MKKGVLSLVTALIVLCSITIFASAAGTEPDITVQLNGQDLEFTDAKPQVKDNRTFLPYRAVFEAMGAEVDYENNMVTARRGDTELSMTIGDTTATVTRGDTTDTLTMDVAPYVDNATWRTYVPVRFAADAFGCSVGWNQDTMTVTIVDIGAMVDKALAGKEFTLLEKYMEYSEKYNVGAWAANGSMDASVSLLGSETLPLFTGTVEGIVSGNAAGEMSISMDMDLGPLMSCIAYLTDTTLADMDVTEDDLRMDMVMNMKLDMDAGTMYLQMDDAMNAALGLPTGTWMSMDMNAIPVESGMEEECNALLTQVESMNPVELLNTLLADVSLDEQAFTSLADTLDTAITALSDKGFQKTSNGYETSLTLSAKGMECVFAMALTTTNADEVTGYSMDVSVILPLDEELKATLAESGLTADQISMNISTSVDKNDQMQAVFQISMAPLFAMDINMEMNYTATTQTPDTALPANATVVDYMTLMASIAATQE